MTTAYLNRIATAVPEHDVHDSFVIFAEKMLIDPRLRGVFRRMVSRAAVGDTSVKPESNVFTPRKEQGARNNRASDDLPFDSSGGLSVDYHFPVDGQYVIKVKLPPVVQGFDAPSQVPTYLEMKIPVKAGNHHVGATFLAENFVPEALGTGAKRAPVVPDAAVTAQLDVRLDGERVLRLYYAIELLTGAAIPAPGFPTLAGSPAGFGDAPPATVSRRSSYGISKAKRRGQR